MLVSSSSLWSDGSSAQPFSEVIRFPWVYKLRFQSLRNVSVLEHPLYMVCNVCNYVLVMTAHILFTHLTHPLYRLKCTERRGVLYVPTFSA